MTWTDGTIGDLVALQRGHDLVASEQKPGDVPVVGSAGPNGFHDVAIAKGPGVTLGRSGGSIGRVTYVSSDYWPHNTCIYVTDFKGNHPRFVAYLLSRLNLAQLNSGAAQPSLNRNFIYSVKIRYPDPSAQKRVAGMLSAYDDLVENNRRRIQLLEQSARLLYREWFVHLRFPGHEHVRVVDGVPEGWERKPLGELVTLNYGKALKEEVRVPGPYSVYGSSGVVGTHDKALVDGPGIIVGRKGNVGSVYWCAKSFFPIDTVYFVDAQTSDLFLYYALKHMRFISTDVAVPGLNRDFAYSRPLLIPSRLLIDEFLDSVKPMHQQIDKLTEMNEKLAAARDLLLPRLMSGEITV